MEGMEQEQSVRGQRNGIDLIRQMAECDANYIRLLKLVPGLDQARDQDFQQGTAFEFTVANNRHAGDQVNIQISVLESFRYTTTLRIEQIPATGHWLDNPAMEVRVYHDTFTAEVVTCRGQRNFETGYAQPNPRMYQRDEKLQVNRFLGEWLAHCLAFGRCVTVPDFACS